MKKLYQLVFLSLLFCSYFYAQTVVEPGDGTLYNAILNAKPNEVLILREGGIYTHSSSSSIGILRKPITIQVEEGAKKKALIKLADTTKNVCKYFFVIMDSSALTLRGLEIHGMLSGNDTVMSMIAFDGLPDPTKVRVGTFRFENCIFHDFTDNIVHGMKEASMRGIIQDSVIINNVIVYHADAFLQYKHVSLRYLEIKNSTIYQLRGMALKIGKEFNYRLTKITPSGIIDHCTFDRMGDIHGHIQVDNAYSTLTISNSIFTNQDQFNQPPIYFLEPRIDTAVVIKNSCFWNVAPLDRDKYGKLNGYVFKDSITYNPQYKDPANGDFTLPSDSPLLKYGSDGNPIGDPRWTIQDVTNIDLEKENIPKQFSLLQNYPNPFNPSTVISYQLPARSQVSLKVYDILGREVVTLVNEVQDAGFYNYHFSINNLLTEKQSYQLSSGVYFYKLQSGENFIVKKMILTK